MGPVITSAATLFLRGVSSAYSSSSSWSSVFWVSKMPRVDADLKLDFKDVLFRPKRSSLKSRSEVGSVNYLQWIMLFNSYSSMSHQTRISLRRSAFTLLKGL